MTNYYNAPWSHTQDSRTDVISVHYAGDTIAEIPGDAVRDAGIETEPGFEQRQFVFYTCIDEIQQAIDMERE